MNSVSALPAWPARVFRSLLPSADSAHTAIDIYCGAGGLSLGFAALGFQVTGVDSDKDAVATFRANVGQAKCLNLNDQMSLGTADVLLAGPPCQPWSRAGKQLGELDDRDGFPTVTRALDCVRPTIVVVENVPDISLHRRRTRLDEFISQLSDRGYAITEAVLNASHYGVPQRRRRAFVFGVCDGTPLQLPIPQAAEVPAVDAIPDTYQIAPPDARFLTKQMDRYIARYEKASQCRVPRDLHLDQPARTLTVRNLAGATGDMMRLPLPCGRRRMLTIQEAARLQSFPDWFRFVGSRRSQFSQIGNAVPPLLSLAIAKEVLRRLNSLSNDPSSPITCSAGGSAR